MTAANLATDRTAGGLSNLTGVGISAASAVAVALCSGRSRDDLTTST